MDLAGDEPRHAQERAALLLAGLLFRYGVVALLLVVVLTLRLDLALHFVEGS